jgi:hypothetical protein
MKKIFLITTLLLLGYNGFSQETVNTIIIPKEALDRTSTVSGGIYAIVMEEGYVYSNENRYLLSANVNGYDKAMATMTIGYFKAQMEEEFKGRRVKCCFKLSAYAGGQLASWQGAEYIDKDEKENLKQVNLVWEGLAGNCVVVVRVAMDSDSKAKNYLDAMIAKAKGIDFTKL